MFPYYSSYSWLALVYDFNSNDYIVTIYLTALNAWSNILYNLYFTAEFIYVLYNVYGGKNSVLGGGGRNIQLIVIKSLCHFVTSTIANLMYIYYYYFLPDSLTFSFCYNIVICMGLHFFFNVKIDRYILAAFPMKQNLTSQHLNLNLPKDENHNDGGSKKSSSKYNVSNNISKKNFLKIKSSSKNESPVMSSVRMSSIISVRQVVACD